MVEERKRTGTTFAVLLVLGPAVLAALFFLVPICPCPCRDEGVVEINSGVSSYFCSVCGGRGRVTLKQKFEVARTGRPPVYTPKK